MAQEDYLKRQIDQLGIVLGKILSNLIKLKDNGQASEGVEITYKTLKDELNIDCLSDFLDKKTYNNSSLETLAEIILIMADNSNSETLYKKVLDIFDYLDKVGDTFSIDRQWKREYIKSKQ